MNENIFRILAALVLFTGIGISSYFRRKADRDTGEKISRKVDGTAFMTVIKISALILWFSPLVYLINPAWMAWSKIGLPDGLTGIGGDRQEKTGREPEAQWSNHRSWKPT